LFVCHAKPDDASSPKTIVGQEKMRGSGPRRTAKPEPNWSEQVPRLFGLPTAPRQVPTGGSKGQGCLGEFFHHLTHRYRLTGRLRGRSRNYLDINLDIIGCMWESEVTQMTRFFSVPEELGLPPMRNCDEKENGPRLSVHWLVSRRPEKNSGEGQATDTDPLETLTPPGKIAGQKLQLGSATEICLRMKLQICLDLDTVLLFLIFLSKYSGYSLARCIGISDPHFVMMEPSHVR
jgi:hypothetical protein